MDFNTGRANHIEDCLIELHGGQWFGWADSKNKVYANLVILNSDYDKPSEKSLTDALAEQQAAYPLQELREQRNVLLASSDWMANKDVTLPAAWKTYRQELRDLTTGLDTVEKVNAVTWPTKPS